MLRAALLATVFLAAPAIAAQPNIIVIMTDDQDEASLAGMPKVSARLAQGTRFTNSFVNVPLCSPSRATFLSGQTAGNHGVGDNTEPPPSFFNKGLLPMWLQDAGYTTGLTGVKSLNQYFGAPDTLGFDHWTVVADRNAARYYDVTIDKDGVLTDRPGEYSTDIFRAEANAFARDTAKPYFLFVAVAAPHAPAIPAARHVGLCGGAPLPRPPSFNEVDVSDKPAFVAELPSYSPAKEDRIERAYREKCETMLSVDELAADLIDRAGNNTCVFYTSDHGFLEGPHRITGKLYMYEESLRVPLVMWGCGAAPGGTIDAMVYNPDLTAAISELAGTTPTRRQDGVSFLPLLEAPQPWRTAMPFKAVGPFKDDGIPDSNCVRTAEWSYCAHSTGEREFYELASDPYQLTNKADRPGQAEVVARLHDLALELADCSGSGCWVTRDPLKRRNRRR
jgi:N-acetylglucosamine-6-sulfatase